MPATSTILSAALGVDLGPWIEVSRFDQVVKLSWARFPNAAPEARVFNHGWNGVGYRTRSAAYHAHEFATKCAGGAAASHEDRYWQDHHGFGFFTSACSAAECIVFAAHAASLGLSRQPLTAQVLKRPRGQMIVAVAGVPATAQLGGLLDGAFAASEGKTLFELRDVLVHRGRPEHNQYASLGGSPGPNDGKILIADNPKDEPGSWSPTIEWGPQLVEQHAKWLRKLVGDACSELIAVLA